ncbi:MAG: formylglycine-generating enzyme family protein, partial [archaeon]|nr:formylglycine-generating enzyme family protein [archaeon]
KGDYLRNHNTITADENANGYRVPTYDEFTKITGYSGSGMIKGNKEAWSEAHVWSSANSDGKTHPVATKEANEYGLYDLLGNVKELCWTTSRDVSNKNSCYPKYHGASYEDSYDTYAGISSNGSPYYKHYDMYGFRVARNCN